MYVRPNDPNMDPRSRDAIELTFNRDQVISNSLFLRAWALLICLIRTIQSLVRSLFCSIFEITFFPWYNVLLPFCYWLIAVFVASPYIKYKRLNSQNIDSILCTLCKAQKVVLKSWCGQVVIWCRDAICMVMEFHYVEMSYALYLFVLK